VVVFISKPQVLAERELEDVNGIVSIGALTALRVRGVLDRVASAVGSHALETESSTAPSLSLETSVETRGNVVLIQVALSRVSLSEGDVLLAAKRGESDVASALDQVTRSELLDIADLRGNVLGDIVVVDVRVIVQQETGNLVDCVGSNGNTVEGLSVLGLSAKIDPVRNRVPSIADSMVKREAGNGVSEPKALLAVEDKITLHVSVNVAVTVILVVDSAFTVTILLGVISLIIVHQPSKAYTNE
jgi:hypothetical protein